MSVALHNPQGAQAPTQFNTEIVTTPTVACDGGKGALGHPRVFLTVDTQTRQVVCPYCSRHYALAEGVSAHGH